MYDYVFQCSLVSHKQTQSAAKDHVSSSQPVMDE